MHVVSPISMAVVPHFAFKCRVHLVIIYCAITVSTMSLIQLDLFFQDTPIFFFFICFLVSQRFIHRNFLLCHLSQRSTRSQVPSQVALATHQEIGSRLCAANIRWRRIEKAKYCATARDQLPDDWHSFDPP
jgi:hypothetical protein